MSFAGPLANRLSTTGANTCHVQELRQNASLYLDKSNVLYGPSKSGKTVYTKHIMNLLRPFIEQILVVAPTEPTNQSYVDCVPRPMMHYQCKFEGAVNEKGKLLEGKPAVMDFLGKIILRQQMLSEIHAKVSNPQVLQSLYTKCRNPAGDNILRAFAAKRRAQLAEAQRRAASPTEAGDATKKINDLFDQMETTILKKFVGAFRGEFLAGKRGKLTEDQKYTLEYLNLNHRLLLIFDDCAAELKPYFRTEQFRKLFYQGRHIGVTLIMCCQDDTDLDLNLRKNVFIAFYMTAEVAIAAFNRAGILKSTRDYVNEIIPVVYGEPFRKLVFIRDDKAKFYHTIVPVPPRFRFGSPELWRLCERIGAAKGKLDTTNPYYDRFKLE